MCANPDDPMFEPLYEGKFNLKPDDFVQVIQYKRDHTKNVLYSFQATKAERVRIRIDRDTQYPPLDEKDGA